MFLPERKKGGLAAVYYIDEGVYAGCRPKCTTKQNTRKKIKREKLKGIVWSKSLPLYTAALIALSRQRLSALTRTTKRTAVNDADVHEHQLLQGTKRTLYPFLRSRVDIMWKLKPLRIKHLRVSEKLKGEILFLILFSTKICSHCLRFDNCRSDL